MSNKSQTRHLELDNLVDWCTRQPGSDSGMHTDWGLLGNHRVPGSFGLFLLTKNNI